MGTDLETDMKMVEFFGLPGSGKSTIAQLAISSLKKEGYAVDEHPVYIGNTVSTAVRMFVKLKSTLIFSLLHFNFMYGLFKSLGKTPFKSVNEAVKQWVNICYVLTEYRKASKNKQYRIFDQGLAQASISLTYNCKGITADIVLNELLKKVKASPYFVYIQADANTVLIRLKQRKIGRTRVVENTNNEHEKKEILKNIELSCEDIINHSSIKLKRYQNEENFPLQEICQRIVYDCLLMMEENNEHKRASINYNSNL